MGGWNKKSVMSPNLLVVDRNKQAGASPLRSGHTSHITPIPLLYHQYHYYTTNITSISFHYHSTVLLCWAQQSFGYGPRAKRSRGATRAGLVVSDFAP